MDNVTVDIHASMPELLTIASCRKDWNSIFAELFLLPLPHPRPSKDDPIGQRTELNELNMSKVKSTKIKSRTSNQLYVRLIKRVDERL